MNRFYHTLIWGSLAFGTVASAAEYRFVVGGSSGPSGDGWHLYGVNDSDRVPAEPTAPGGFEISYPSSPGTDSLIWRNRRGGMLVHTCLSCPSSSYIPWLSLALSAAPLIPEGPQVLDTQQVTVGGVSREYITASKTLLLYGTSTMSAFLEGVGTVYYWQSNNPNSSSSWWNASLRLVEYNGINIDTLWGDELPGPTAITPSVRRETAPRFGQRRFDLKEMGIFLGRKSALDHSKPLPTGVK